MTEEPLSSTSIVDMIPPNVRDSLHDKSPKAWQEERLQLQNIGTIGTIMEGNMTPDVRANGQGITRLQALIMAKGKHDFMPIDQLGTANYRLAIDTINRLILLNRPDVLKAAFEGVYDEIEMNDAQIEAIVANPASFDFTEFLKRVPNISLYLDQIEEVGLPESATPKTKLSLIVDTVIDKIKSMQVSQPREDSPITVVDLTDSEMVAGIGQQKVNAWGEEQAVLEKLGPLQQLFKLKINKKVRESSEGISRIQALIMAHGGRDFIPADQPSRDNFNAALTSINELIILNRPDVVKQALEGAYGFEEMPDDAIQAAIGPPLQLPTDFRERVGNISLYLDDLENIGDPESTGDQTVLSPLVEKVIHLMTKKPEQPAEPGPENDTTVRESGESLYPVPKLTVTAASTFAEGKVNNGTLNAIRNDSKEELRVREGSSVFLVENPQEGVCSFGRGCQLHIDRKVEVNLVILAEASAYVPNLENVAYKIGLWPSFNFHLGRTDNDTLLFTHQQFDINNVVVPDGSSSPIAIGDKIYIIKSLREDFTSQDYLRYIMTLPDLPAVTTEDNKQWLPTDIHRCVSTPEGRFLIVPTIDRDNKHDGKGMAVYQEVEIIEEGKPSRKEWMFVAGEAQARLDVLKEQLKDKNIPQGLFDFSPVQPADSIVKVNDSTPQPVSAEKAEFPLDTWEGEGGALSDGAQIDQPVEPKNERLLELAELDSSLPPRSVGEMRFPKAFRSPGGADITSPDEEYEQHETTDAPSAQTELFESSIQPEPEILPAAADMTIDSPAPEGTINENLQYSDLLTSINKMILPSETLKLLFSQPETQSSIYQLIQQDFPVFYRLIKNDIADFNNACAQLNQITDEKKKKRYIKDTLKKKINNLRSKYGHFDYKGFDTGAVTIDTSVDLEDAIRDIYLHRSKKGKPDALETVIKRNVIEQALKGVDKHFIKEAKNAIARNEFESIDSLLDFIHKNIPGSEPFEYTAGENSDDYIQDYAWKVATYIWTNRVPGSLITKLSVNDIIFNTSNNIFPRTLAYVKAQLAVEAEMRSVKKMMEGLVAKEPDFIPDKAVSEQGVSKAEKDQAEQYESELSQLMTKLELPADNPGELREVLYRLSVEDLKTIADHLDEIRNAPVYEGQFFEDSEPDTVAEYSDLLKLVNDNEPDLPEEERKRLTAKLYSFLQISLQDHINRMEAAGEPTNEDISVMLDPENRYALMTLTHALSAIQNVTEQNSSDTASPKM